MTFLDIVGRIQIAIFLVVRVDAVVAVVIAVVAVVIAIVVVMVVVVVVAVFGINLTPLAPKMIWFRLEATRL